jgi:transcriptional regulator GlxA family with amidase domain
MKHVAILALNDAVSASVADPSILFNGVNDFLKQAGKPPAFKIQIVGLRKAVKLYHGVFTVHADILLEDMKKADLVIIPALGGDLKSAIKKNAAFIPWILKQYKKGADVASLCVGAFLLASTKLLNGKECSTHWLMANEFREMFPEVKLVDGRVVTDKTAFIPVAVQLHTGTCSSIWWKNMRDGNGHHGFQSLCPGDRPEKPVSLYHVQWSERACGRTHQRGPELY